MAKQANYERLNELVKDFQKASLEYDECEAPYKSPEFREVQDNYDRKRRELDAEVAKLRNSEPIKFLREISDMGISPLPALDYWVSSWC